MKGDADAVLGSVRAQLWAGERLCPGHQMFVSSVGLLLWGLVTVLVLSLQHDGAPWGRFLVQPVAPQGDMPKNRYVH